MRHSSDKIANKKFVTTRIIERLDRKLADVIGSNIVEKCDVTLSRAIHPLTSDVLRVLFFLAYFTISVFDYTDCPCFEVKDEEGLLFEKTVRGYKTGRGKGQSKWLWNSWKRRMTPAPDYFMHQTGSLNENLHAYSYKTPIRKAQPNFLQTTRKPEAILIIFIKVLTISFLL